MWEDTDKNNDKIISVSSVTKWNRVIRQMEPGEKKLLQRRCSEKGDAGHFRASRADMGTGHIAGRGSGEFRLGAGHW